MEESQKKREELEAKLADYRGLLEKTEEKEWTSIMVRIREIEKELEQLPLGLDKTMSPTPVMEERQNRSKMAIAGFVLGIASIFLGPSFSLFPILAIIFSSIGLNQTSKGQKGKWMAIFGLLLGIIYLLVNIVRKIGYT